MLCLKLQRHLGWMGALAPGICVLVPLREDTGEACNAALQRAASLASAF